jgi:hypothetical protein
VCVAEVDLLCGRERLAEDAAVVRGFAEDYAAVRDGWKMLMSCLALQKMLLMLGVAAEMCGVKARRLQRNCALPPALPTPPTTLHSLSGIDDGAGRRQ